MDRIELASPAKINLFLEVISRREDGYHQVNTVLQEISLCDYLTFTPNKNKVLVESDLPSIPQEKNLIYITALKVKHYFGIKDGVSIKLSKKIPVAAGLGGGSSNAAATLAGLNTLWKLNLHKEELLSFACSIGADVPFFLNGGTVLCGGRGDILQRQITVPGSFWIVLVNPGFPVMSGEVYQSLNFPLTKHTTDISLLLNSLEEGKIIPELMFNRLEEVVIRKYPILGELKKELLREGAIVSLVSGSGPTLFCMIESEEDARNIEQHIVKKYGSKIYTIVCCTTIR